MRLLQSLTADALQQTKVVLPDGSGFFLQLHYRPQQYGWFINSLTYKTFSLAGLRVTNSPNFLHQWRNRVPFGLACYSTNNREPTQLQDFLSGASKLYLLTHDEVVEYLEYLTGV